MAGHYSPKHFLRQVPNPLLKTFFDRRVELQEIQWSEVGEMEVDPIFEAWQALPEANRNDVERWFRAVAELATPEGLQTLIEEGQFHGVDLTVCLGQLKGVHEKVFWVYLNHERIFFSAGRLNRADHLNGRYWRRRTDLPAKKPDISHPTRELVAQAISKYYRDHQGRGEHCKVEVYLRRDKIHYFFAYPADYADTVIIYNDEGGLERQLQKAAFEVIFAYNESAGTLDVFVQGDKKLRRDMEEIFARLVLKESLPENEPERQPYELNGLRHRDFDFPTDPEDGIQEVRVKALRLSIVGPGFGRITFESDARRKRGDIYDLMEKSLNHARMNAEAINVTRAVLDVVFATGGRPKTVNFFITYPDTCSLKDSPEHLKLKEYLRRWGIASEN
jgi:hypothetical protein